MKKTPLKRKPLKVKRSKIKNYSDKGFQKHLDKINENHLMKEEFFKFWNSRVHICESCGVGLGDELRSYHIDHLLEKSKYPELKLEPLNFYLVCLDCHYKRTNGHPTPKHQEAINKIKELYGA